MRKILYILTVFCSIWAFEKVAAQSTPAKRIRCGTMQALNLYLKDKKANAPVQQRTGTKQPPQTARPFNGVLTIPVVVHLVLSEADQALIKDEDVIWQINRLNLDFSGLNSDSTNGAAFYATRGHSAIKFCLAQQDERGNPTRGINRVVSGISNFSVTTVSRLKNATTCGANAWNPDEYFNIWVARSTELLGIASFAGIGPHNEQGIAIAFEGFSNNPAFVDPLFSSGRTTVHETGHYLGLYHSWGDDEGCASSDFRQLPGTMVINGTDIVGGDEDHTVGDTPNQGDATFGCPTGLQGDACTASGVQYQNYMDYTDDVCYSMFTKLQVKRMEYLLTNWRGGLLTSKGCTPVTSYTQDAALAAIANPGPGACGISGAVSFCTGNAFTPVVQIANVGTATLQSLRIYTQVDGGTITVHNWSGNLAPDSKTFITLGSVTAGISGNHTIKIFTALPNGVSDERTANDTLQFTFNVPAIQPLKSMQEDFSQALFPPRDWRVYNPNNDLTWEHTASVGKKAPGAAWFNDWNNMTNDFFDDLITPNFSYNNVDSVFLHFQVANAMYSDAGSGLPLDTLSVLLSKDCGNTYTTVYKKWGRSLHTAGRSWDREEEFFPSTAAHWRRDSINLGAFLGASEKQFLIAFRFHGNFENNLFIDDVNLYTKVLPPRLKEAGFLILPTATQNQFSVWHYQQPTTLRAITIYNAGGQLVWQKRYNGEAEKFITVNLWDKQAGVYLVQLTYTDAGKNVTQRIIKY